MIARLYRRILRNLFKRHVLKHTSSIVIDELSSQYLMNPAGIREATIRDVKVDLFEGLLRDGHIVLEELKGRRDTVYQATIYTFKV